MPYVNYPCPLNAVSASFSKTFADNINICTHLGLWRLFTRSTEKKEATITSKWFLTYHTSTSASSMRRLKMKLGFLVGWRSNFRLSRFSRRFCWCEWYKNSNFDQVVNPGRIFNQKLSIFSYLGAVSEFSPGLFEKLFAKSENTGISDATVQDSQCFRTDFAGF